jgi:hypothetical protein
MKSQKLILKFACCQFQYLDLRTHLKAKGWILYFRDGQPSLGDHIAIPLPASRILAHTRRAMPPVALGMELKSLGLVKRMRTAQFGQRNPDFAMVTRNLWKISSIGTRASGQPSTAANGRTLLCYSSAARHESRIAGIDRDDLLNSNLVLDVIEKRAKISIAKVQPEQGYRAFRRQWSRRNILRISLK